MWLPPVRRNTYAHHQHGQRLETDYAVEERSSAQEESTREAQGGIAGCVVLAQDEALKLKHNSIGAEHILDGLLCERGTRGVCVRLDVREPQETRSRGARVAVPPFCDS